MSRRVRAIAVLLVAALGLALWIACAWIWPGRIVVGDVVGAAMFLIAVMRIMHPAPQGRCR